MSTDTNIIEKWKPIIGYEGIYEISNIGRVKRLGYIKYDKRGRKREDKTRILKPYINCQTGYKTVTLSRSSKRKYMTIHRLVAKAFIPNPENKPQVNHISEKKEDNKVCNLEWVTVTENVNHGTAIERKSKKLRNGLTSKKIIQSNLNNEFIKEWVSISECGRNGFNKAHIISCCKNRLKKHKNYKWKYAI